ncbi:hypothetical protein T05_10892 [Trichinella murrelli]|uniref:Secreted protein n=1 Tax=Trichinella murrelli TaxID=144512 RepID=A0A0V0UDH3_9BILA|nr:hypothetical protein T05_10892 [Trichinella murrelli]
MMLLIFLTSYLYILCREQLLLEMDPQRAVVLKLFWAATHFRNGNFLRPTCFQCIFQKIRRYGQHLRAVRSQRTIVLL